MMALKGNIKFLIYAMLLYLPTLAHMRAELFLLAIGAVLWFERKSIIEQFKDLKSNPFSTKYLFSFWLVLLILIGSLSNKIINGDDILCLRDYYSSFYLFPLLILVSKYFGKIEIFKFLILFTVAEIGVASIEYAVGTRSFLLDLGSQNIISDRSLLYESRCYGLSVSSSIFSYKVLIAVILLEFTKFSKAISWVLRVALLIGVILSFSRAVVVVLILFWVLRAFYGMMKAYRNRDLVRSAPFQFNVLMVLLIVIFNSFISFQLSRGGHEAESIFGDGTEKLKLAPSGCAEVHAIEYQRGETDPTKQGWGEKIMMRSEGVQTSGRKLIWLNYLNFTEKNLMFGKGSDKAMLRSWQDHLGVYKLIHAHNSFLMLLASNGILIAGLYFLFYLFNFKSRNFLAIFTIVTYSLFNYGIFWGFSYLDVIFIVLLTLKFKDVYDYQRED